MLRTHSRFRCALPSCHRLPGSSADARLDSGKLFCEFVPSFPPRCACLSDFLCHRPHGSCLLVSFDCLEQRARSWTRVAERTKRVDRRDARKMMLNTLTIFAASFLRRQRRGLETLESAEAGAQPFRVSALNFAATPAAKLEQSRLAHEDRAALTKSAAPPARAACRKERPEGCRTHVAYDTPRPFGRQRVSQQIVQNAIHYTAGARLRGIAAEGEMQPASCTGHWLRHRAGRQSAFL